eukprot:CAMPEP_0197036522 /NCGR_PEP_ID=MMETSP1384-20130603/14000_1 /TAXON_ID=29189 /ORGANISM="Ammonia sp." /LENGTH=410 /DNA_ID=CAMNT_0042466711 /DNA_START=1 /DNA_END=1233 /DNA_ORIENTATION=+
MTSSAAVLEGATDHDALQSQSKSTSSTRASSESFSNEKTKFVVRKIPIFVTEDEIKEHLQEFESTYDWFHFCSQPNVPNPTRRSKQRFNRFYINFKSLNHAIPFIEKFKKIEFRVKPLENTDDDDKTDSNSNSTSNGNHVTQNHSTPQAKAKEGKSYKVTVEFAPNQQLPAVITTTDRRTATIEADADYIAFVESLTESKKRTEQIRKETEQASIRRTVIDTFARNKSSKTVTISSTEEQEAEPQIAPLAQHVAAQRSRRSLSSKKLDRASLVKSQKAKERMIERVREMRRKKRLALAKMTKYAVRDKYGGSSKQWVAKSGDDDAPRGKHAKRGDEEVGYDEYYSHHKSARSRRKKRRERERERERDRETKSAQSGYSQRENAAPNSSEGKPHFSGYSRRRGHQKWKKAQ